MADGFFVTSSFSKVCKNLIEIWHKMDKKTNLNNFWSSNAINFKFWQCVNTDKSFQKTKYGDVTSWSRDFVKSHFLKTILSDLAHYTGLTKHFCEKPATNVKVHYVIFQKIKTELKNSFSNLRYCNLKIAIANRIFWSF